MKAHRAGVKQVCAGLLTFAWAAAALAEALTNPTRPPAEWLALTQSNQQDSAVADPGAKQSLQMLVVGKTRKIAVVDGQVFKVGDSYNGLRVIGVRADGLVLQGDDGTPPQYLKLAPEIEKKVVAGKNIVGAAGRSGAASEGSKRVSTRGTLVIGEGK